MFQKGHKKFGNGGFKKGQIFTKEHRKNLSIAHQGIKNPKQSETMKRLYLEDKLSKNIGAKGKDNSSKKEETKLKISKTRIERGVAKGENNPFYKKHYSEESKLKSRLSHLGVPNPKQSETKKRLFKEGKLVIWNKNKKNIYSNDYINKMKEKRAKQVFPLKDTKIEVKIQNFLKVLGIEYFTHQYIKNIEHGYQCDILIPLMNMIIECDGNYWHGNPLIFPNPNTWQQEQINEDRIRTTELIAKGFKVLRLWECEIKQMDVEQFKNKLNQIDGVKI